MLQNGEVCVTKNTRKQQMILNKKKLNKHGHILLQQVNIQCI